MKLREWPLWGGVRGSYQTVARRTADRLVLFTALVAAVAAARAVGAERFAVQMRDGTLRRASQLTDWQAKGATPKLDGQTLGDWQWILDYQAHGTESGAAGVDLLCGDRLPGQVIGHAVHQGRPYWIVRPSLARSPTPSPDQRLMVDARFVRRIVWHPITGRVPRERLAPGTLLRSDGSRVEAEAIRIGVEQFEVLTREGVRQVPFGEAGEYWAEATDDWAGYLATLRAGNPQLQETMVRWETADGLRVTAVESSFQLAGKGQPWDSDSWWHALQPIWSTAPLWVPARSIRLRQRFLPLEAPLTLVWPEVDEGDPPCRNANASGNWLFAGDRPHGWGWGVLAPSTLRFPLPAQAVGLRLECGLDYAADTVGAAAGRVAYRSGRVQVLFQTPVEMGHGRLESMEADLPPWSAGSPRRLLELRVSDAPGTAAAAPLNWGDLWDWIAPTVLLDRAAMLQALEKQVP